MPRCSRTRALGGLQGELTLKVENAGAAQKVSFTGENVIQHWATGRDLKLRLYREDTLGSADLTIEARGRADNEDRRSGKYRLNAVQTPAKEPSRTVNLQGFVSCSVGY